MRQCNKCNYHNPDYINICLNCGNELEEFKNRTLQEDTVSEASDDKKIAVNDDCDCGINHDELYHEEDIKTEDKYSDNYYVDNSYQIESVPVDYNGHKSYYEYLQSMKNEIKPKKSLFSLNNNKILLMLALFIVVILVITPTVVSSIQESSERNLFNTYAASSINLEVTANDFLVEIISSNMTTAEKIDVLDNMTSGLNSSINTLESFEDAATNDTYKEFMNLQIETLKVDKEALDSYKEFMDIENKFEKGKISDTEAYDLLQKVDFNQSNNEKVLTNHKKMNDIIEQNPLMKSDFNTLRITPIYQTLARSANQTGNNSTNITNNTTSM